MNVFPSIPLPCDGLPEGCLTEVDGQWVVWGFRTDFGSYLSGLRDDARMSLRQAAAAAVGVSHSKLSQLEHGQYTSAPSAGLLGRLAAVYGVPAGEMLYAAGYRIPGEDTSPQAGVLVADAGSLSTLLADAIPALAGLDFSVVVVLSTRDLRRLRAGLTPLATLEEQPPPLP